MSTPTNPKDIWDKVSAVTPLLIGIFITGIGGYFTHIYNFRQLQLLEVTTIDKFRPLLTSENPQECEYAYTAIVAIGQGELVKRLTDVYQDQCGRSALEKLEEQGSEEAAEILKALDQKSQLELEKLVGNIYSDERITRRNATSILASDRWLDESLSLIPELVLAYNKNTDNTSYNYGLVNTLFLLDKVSTESFENNLDDIKKIVKSASETLGDADKKKYLSSVEKRINTLEKL